MGLELVRLKANEWTRKRGIYDSGDAFEPVAHKPSAVASWRPAASNAKVRCVDLTAGWPPASLVCGLLELGVHSMEEYRLG